MKKLIDANVILRYLLDDHAILSEKAKEIVELGAYTLPEVIAEVVYVLKGVYKVERRELAEALQEFMQEIDIEHKDVIFASLEIYADTSLDFVDCILIAYHKVWHVEIASFDKKLNRQLLV